MIESNGHIISGTSICVDFWLWTPEKKYHHFLTHLHADHTVNLTSTFCETIYTSPFNAWLLTRWFNINPEHIIAIDVGESLLVYDENDGSRFSATLLDANHCPGAVMFLFQGTFGNILYTGDFRYQPGIFGHPMLKSLIENEAVDRLYLDNTFAAEHCEFPSRQKALEDILNLIKAHPDHNVILGVRRLGKEEVLRAVALEFKEKVCVSEDKMRILTKLGYENVFTTDPEESRIFVKEMPQINLKFIDQLRAERGPVVTILLSAIYSVIPPQATHLGIAKDTDQGIHKIPYTDHSCHSELVEFVSRIKPKQIIPIVSISGSNKANSRINCDQSDILSCTWQNSLIPERIMRLAGNPHQWKVINPEPIGHRKCETVSNLEFKDYSKTTSNKVEAVKSNSNQIQEKSIDKMSKIDENTERPNKIIGKGGTKRKHPVNVNTSASKSKNQRICLNQRPTHVDSEVAVSNSEECEEYFALSDEDLSQIKFKSEKQKVCSDEKTSHTHIETQPSNPQVSEENFILLNEDLTQIGVAYDQNGNSCSKLTSNEVSGHYIVNNENVHCNIENRGMGGNDNEEPESLIQLEGRNAKFDALSVKGNCINQQKSTSLFSSTETEQNVKSDRSKHSNSLEQTILGPLCQSSTFKKLEDICTGKKILENPTSKINLHKDNNLPQLDGSSLKGVHHVNEGQSKNVNIMPSIEVSTFKPSKSIFKTLSVCHTDVSSLIKISQEGYCSKLKDVNNLDEEDKRRIYETRATTLNRIFQPPKRRSKFSKSVRTQKKKHWTTAFRVSQSESREDTQTGRNSPEAKTIKSSSKHNIKGKPLSYYEICQTRHALVNWIFREKASTTEKEVCEKNCNADAVSRENMISIPEAENASVKHHH